MFGFALIHGLGLAGALGDLGLDLRHRLWSLAGFNAGVEAGQLAVALVAVAAFAALRSPARAAARRWPRGWPPARRWRPGRPGWCSG